MYVTYFTTYLFHTCRWNGFSIQKYMFRKNLPVIVLEKKKIEYYILMFPLNLKVYIPGTLVTVLCIQREFIAVLHNVLAPSYS